MAEEMKKYLQKLLARIDGLYCVLITDRDGVPVVKATTDEVPELAMRPSFLSTFAMATDQAGKLGLGKNKTMICMYSSYQVVHINRLPLVISMIGSSDCNTGHMLSLQDHIEPLVHDLNGAVSES